MWNFLCWKMWYVLTDVFSGSCLNFFFYTVAHFHLVGRLFSFSHRHFHVFPPTKFVSCFFSNALALLLMSLKTLKFSRTWLCCWFFSLLSPDGLSLSKKLGWILVFPKKKSLCCICHTCWLSYFTFSGMPACDAEGGAYAQVIIYAQWTKILIHGVPLRARELAKNVCGEPRRQKTPK